MMKRVLTLLLAAGLLAAGALTALTFPASAQTQTVYVELATGEVVPVQGRRAGRVDSRRHPAAWHHGPSRPGRPPPPHRFPTTPTEPKPAPKTPAPAPGRQ